MKRVAWIAVALGVAGLSRADVTVTLDMNGFLNAAGGRVSGTGLKQPIEVPGSQPKVELPGLQPGGIYYVDFFHNTGEGSSDFSFTITDDGKGVRGVSLGGGEHKMVTGFKPGDTTLKLNTREITYNDGGRQKGSYYLAGATAAHTVPADKGPLKFLTIPGYLSVDNLTNTASGREDFAFTVDSEGKVGPRPGAGAAEFAEFEGSTVRPRAARVMLTIRSVTPIVIDLSHAPISKTVEGNVTKLDMYLPIGGGGLSAWSFGPSRVVRTTLTRPDGKSAEGEQAVNDFRFYPIVRYDDQKGFMFETTRGLAKEVGAVVTGMTDDGKAELNVEFTATIVADPPATRP